MAKLPPSGTPPTRPSAQRDAAQQDGFLREVDEALREERVIAAFKRYGKPVGAGLLIALIVLAAYLYRDAAVKREAALRSERAVLALDKVQAGQLDAAAKDFTAMAGEGPPAMRALAALNLAALSAQQGKAQEAAQRFAAIAADPAAPALLRELATLREVTLRYDTMKPAEVIARLKPLAIPGKAWFGSAGELLAMAYLDNGQPDQAGALFAQIGQDKTVPQSLRARVRQIASGLGYDGGVELPAEVPPDPGAAANAAPAPPQPAPAPRKS